ncbi:MAG: hypothetical protein ABW139_10930 [Candidatus Thiodiazotropha sp. DIVDIV]
MNRSQIHHAATFPAKGDRGVEYIELAGVIDVKGRFHALPMRSKAVVRSRSGSFHKLQEPPLELELLDKSGKVLSHEKLIPRHPVICARQNPGWCMVQGRIALVDDASSLRLTRTDRVILERVIADAPRLMLNWPHKRVSRKKSFALELDFSPPEEGALIEIHLISGGSRSRFIGAGAPNRKLALDFEDLPGGKACQLSVTYSNGIRSTTVLSESFELAPRQGSILLVHPEEDVKAPSWQPIPLYARWSSGDQEDLKHTRKIVAELVWKLDGKEVGRGPRGLLAAQDEGKHKLTLHAEGREIASRKIHIEKSKKREEPAAFNWHLNR